MVKLTGYRYIRTYKNRQFAAISAATLRGIGPQTGSKNPPSMDNFQHLWPDVSKSIRLVLGELCGPLVKLLFQALPAAFNWIEICEYQTLHGGYVYCPIERWDLQSSGCSIDPQIQDEVINSTPDPCSSQSICRMLKFLKGSASSPPFPNSFL